MILVQAIIQPIKLSAVREALEQRGFTELIVGDALGYGRQKGQRALFRGNEYQIDLLRKVTVEMMIDEDDLEEVLATLRGAARMGSRGEIGDGKIFILPISRVIPL